MPNQGMLEPFPAVAGWEAGTENNINNWEMEDGEWNSNGEGSSFMFVSVNQSLLNLN